MVGMSPYILLLQLVILSIPRRVNVTFTDRDGDVHTVRARLGDNLLEVAREYDIDLEGMCLLCISLRIRFQWQQYTHRQSLELRPILAYSLEKFRTLWNHVQYIHRGSVEPMPIVPCIIGNVGTLGLLTVSLSQEHVTGLFLAQHVT